MPDPSFGLRVPASGVPVTGTPGHALAFDSTGQKVLGVPFPSGPGFVVVGTPAAGKFVGYSVEPEWEIIPPFKADYYVDPGFTGARSGSSSNPFATVAAVFAAAAALGITSGVINLPPNTTLNEDIVFPVSGSWEIRGVQGQGLRDTIINGTVSVSCSALARHGLSSLSVLGAVSADNSSSASCRFYLVNVDLESSLTLASSGSGLWRCYADGIGAGAHSPSAAGGFIAGTVSVAGDLDAFAYGFFGDISVSASNSAFNECFMAFGSFTSTAGASRATMIGCRFGAPLTFTATTGTLGIVLVGFSAEAIMAAGAIASSSAVTLRTVVANGNTVRQTFATNAGVFTLTNRYPLCLMVVEYSLTILVPGSVGALQINLFYTDLVGTPRTKTLLVTPLDVTSAAGTEVSGSFVFSQNGSIAVQCSFTGVVTAGALSYSAGVALRAAA
jgi:hypothetical protein